MIPEWVNDYIGIPYVEDGRTRAGLDCWGLIVLVWREVYGRDLPVYDGPHWARDADRRVIAAAIALEVERYESVPAGSEREGDGIILRMAGHPLHVGLVVAPGWMLHSHETAASCIENYRSIAWCRRVIGFRRYRG